MIGKKRKEARRLCEYVNNSNMNMQAVVTRLSNQYLVSILIKGTFYSYPIGLKQLRGSEQERNTEFVKFICDSMLDKASKIRGVV